MALMASIRTSSAVIAPAEKMMTHRTWVYLGYRRTTEGFGCTPIQHHSLDRHRCPQGFRPALYVATVIPFKSFIGLPPVSGLLFFSRPLQACVSFAARTKARRFFREAWFKLCVLFILRPTMHIPHLKIVEDIAKHPEAGRQHLLYIEGNGMNTRA